MSVVLVSGCSYTDSALWPGALYPNDEIINLGKSGAGNTYIADSVISTVRQTTGIREVFIMFSGVNRSDLVIPATPLSKEFIKEYKFGTILDNRCYVFSGGDKYSQLIVRNYNNIRDESWPTVETVDDYLRLPNDKQQECVNHGILPFRQNNLQGLIQGSLMLNYLNNKEYLSDQTYLAMLNCFSVLESLGIAYHFTFFYNPFDNDYVNHFGTLNRNSTWYKKINWSKYIKKTPFEFGIAHNLLADDNVHMTPEGSLKWAQKIKKAIM